MKYDFYHIFLCLLSSYICNKKLLYLTKKIKCLKIKYLGVSLFFGVSKKGSQNGTPKYLIFSVLSVGVPKYL